MFFKLGVSLLKLKRYDEAIKCFDKAKELNSKRLNFTSSHFENTQAELVRIEESIKFYDKIIKLEPNDPVAYNNKGVNLFKLKRNKDAIEQYNKAIQLNQNYSKAYLNKGVALADSKNFNECFQCFDKSIELKPTIEAFWFKGNVFFDIAFFISELINSI